MKLILHRQRNRKGRKRKEFLGGNRLRCNICGGNCVIPFVMASGRVEERRRWVKTRQGNG